MTNQTAKSAVGFKDKFLCERLPENRAVGDKILQISTKFNLI